MGYTVNHNRLYRIVKKLEIEGKVRHEWRVPKYIKYV